MKGTPTFQLRDTDSGHLRIVRVGVEYPPDATPDAPITEPGARAIACLHTPRGTLTTAATQHGFDLPMPQGGGKLSLIYQRGDVTMQVSIDGDDDRFGFPLPINSPNWSQITDVPSGQDVKAWPTA